MTSTHRTRIRLAGMSLATALVVAGVLSTAPPASASPAPAVHLVYQSAPNWAGYVASSSAQSVTTTMVAPTVASCGHTEVSNSSFWAGLDGINSPTVEQDGIAATCGDGFIQEYAWWEMYNSSGDQSGPFQSVVVHPGDLVTATVYDQGGGNYELTVTDATSHTSQSAVKHASGADDASGECIAEDPGGANGPVPYTNYGTITFTNCAVNAATTNRGVTLTGGTPVGATPKPIQMTGMGATNPNAMPSMLTNNTGFTVTRLFPGPWAPNLPRPVTGMAAMPNGNGYWLVDAAGAVSAHGAAKSYGSLAGVRLNAPIAHIVSTPSGHGYWMVASDGGLFAFGDAGFYGSMGSAHLNKPVVALAPTPTGHGYWMVASDGGVFAFGDAGFHGSMGSSHLNQPVVGLTADPATGGYWMVASDGGIFAFAAPFLGSTGSTHLTSPILAIEATGSSGYRMVTSGGTVYAFGTAAFAGDLTGVVQVNPVVGMAADPASGGYWLVDSAGTITPFSAPFDGSY